MRDPRPYSVAAISAAVLGFALLAQQQLADDPPRILLGLILLALVAACLLLRRRLLALLDARHRLLAIALPFVLSAAVFGVALYLHARLPAHVTLAVVAWLVALLTFLLACWAWDRRQPWQRHAAVGWTRLDSLLLGAALVVALPLRAIGLTAAPRTMSGDEASMGMEALRVLQGTLRDPFSTGWLSHPTLWFFLQSVSLRVFGENLFGLRMLSALLGTLAVGTMYGFARLLFTRRIAACAAFLLATYHFHIHYSRMGLNNIGDPLLGGLIFVSLALAWRTQRRLLFGITGVWLGLALYFYHGARLFIPLLLVLGVVWCAQAGPWTRRRIPAAHMLAVGGLVAAGAVLASGPLIQTFAAHPADFTARLAMEGVTPRWLAAEAQQRGQSRLAVVWDQLKRASLAFNSYPDRSPFYDTRRPLLWGLAAALLLLGLLLALSRIRRPAYQIPVAWYMLAVVFGGAMLQNPPSSPRYITLAPVVCLFIAFAVDWLARQVSLLTGRSRWAPQLFAGGLVLYLAVVSLNGYFREYLPREDIGGGNTAAANALAAYLREQPPDTKVWFLGAPRMFYHGFATLDFLARNVQAEDVLEPIQDVAQVPNAAQEHITIYAVLPERRSELALIQQRYPGGELRALGWPAYAESLIEVYRLAERR